MAQMVTLISCDAVEYDVEVTVACMSKRVKDKIFREGARGPIRLDKVNGGTLGKVVDYCRYHIQCARAGAIEGQRVPANLIASWDAQFVSVLNWQELTDLFRAAHYMNIKKLRDLTSQQISHAINLMSNEDLKTYFNVPDFRTEAEEKRIRRALIRLWGL